ncbi:hypothetical protein BRADI_4g26976v3 [Brachypodium distachyon]|uniref:Uncharacterized protein n=1 Tax=Brachypodium distachyon TaxID=15368 RepID=A0A0Q3EQF7_BRADI|nr:hypothetical protein BRADI_4g26976v3 [Brachypodium distachyon]
MTSETVTGDNSKTKAFFGVIEEIWELEYTITKIPMFRVRWTKGDKEESHRFMTMVLPPEIPREQVDPTSSGRSDPRGGKALPEFRDAAAVYPTLPEPAADLLVLVLTTAPEPAASPLPPSSSSPSPTLTSCDPTSTSSPSPTLPSPSSLSPPPTSCDPVPPSPSSPTPEPAPSSSDTEERDNERRVEESNPQPIASTAKKPRKKTPRGSHNLKEFCYVVTRHSDRGRPESPERAFATTCGAVARKYCKITDEWSDISEVVRNTCIADVARRFQVTDEWRERFLASVNIAVRNGLANWKTTARKWMDKPYEIIKKKWSSITDEAEWEKFKKESSDLAFIAKSERMRALRTSKPLNHMLGSAEKEGKKKVWRK